MLEYKGKDQKSGTYASAAAVTQRKKNGSSRGFSLEDNRQGQGTVQLRAKMPTTNGLHPGQHVLQAKGFNEANQLKAEEPVQKSVNRTGLPDDLKAGVENLSGLAMDDVRVHYNSEKPAQLQAHAFTQGTEIHVAPGQEKHLPHEAWHVVQQKQGRVQPTMQMAGGVVGNDDKGLEAEAEVFQHEEFPRVVGLPPYGNDCLDKVAPEVNGKITAEAADDDKQAPVVNNRQPLQRKVTDLKLSPDTGVKTLRKVLSEDPALSIYHQSDLSMPISSTRLDRAKTASAVISGKTQTGGRGTKTKEYEDIKRSARWEELATACYGGGDYDVGHLIGDQFFSKDAKEEAYDPGNLAPESASYNRGLWKSNENALKIRLKDPLAAVKYTVTVGYDNDLEMKVSDLVEKNVLSYDDTDLGIVSQHEDNKKNGKILTVPSRIPSKAHIPKYEAVIATSPMKSKRSEKVTDALEKQWEISLESCRGKYPANGNFTWFKPYSIDSSNVYQRPIGYDPTNQVNPLKRSFNDASRNTNDQVKRAKVGMSDRKKYRLLQSFGSCFDKSSDLLLGGDYNFKPMTVTLLRSCFIDNFRVALSKASTSSKTSEARYMACEAFNEALVTIGKLGLPDFKIVKPEDIDNIITADDAIDGSLSQGESKDDTMDS